MIVLYSNNLKYICDLPDCIQCEVAEELNTSFELVMEYVSEGSGADNLATGRYIYCKPNPYDKEQWFRIYRITKTIQGVIDVYAEHMSYAFNHFVCRPSEGTGVNSLIGYLNGEATFNSGLTHAYTLLYAQSGIPGGTEWKVPEHTEIKDVMCMAVKVFGGEWKFDNAYATLYYKRGENRDVSLKYGSNIVSFSADTDTSGNYTHIFPYWTGNDENGDEVTIYSEPLFVELETGSSYAKPYILNCSSYFSIAPSPSDLAQKAREFLVLNYGSIGMEIASFDVDVVQRSKTLEGAYLTDADHIEIGDTIQIDVMDIYTTRRCVSTRYDVLGDRLISITLGKKRTSITDLIAEKESSAVDEDKPKDDDPLKDAIPDRVVKVNDNQVYALYGDTKVTWTADGTDNVRYNFKKKVSTKEQNTSEKGNDYDLQGSNNG